MPTHAEPGRPRRRAVRVLAGAALLVLAAGAAWAWWWGLPALFRLAGPGRDAAEVRLHLTTARAGLLATVVGALALWWRWRVGRALRAAADAAERALRADLNSRFARAAALAGSGDAAVRRRGIGALEQLVADSPRPEVRDTVVRFLCGFVRTRSDALHRYRTAHPGTDGSALEQRQRAVAHVARLGAPPDDVQAALTVLGRLPSRGDPADAGAARLDLAGARLRGARLRGANLGSAELSGADLTAADLGGADLRGAGLGWATLVEADLVGADLTGAVLRGADLRGAVLTGAQGVTAEQLTGAYGDGSTELPEGLAPPVNWTRTRAGAR